jgi:hypothetical protein
VTRRLGLLFALALASLPGFASSAGAQRVAIGLPRDSVFIGDTIKNVTATAYDSRNRRVPSAKFAWSSSATAVRVVPNGNGASAMLIGVAPSIGTPVTVKATWNRSDGAKPSASVTVRALARAVPPRTVVASVGFCFIKPSVAESLHFHGDSTFNSAAFPAGICKSTADSASEWLPGARPAVPPGVDTTVSRAGLSAAALRSPRPAALPTQDRLDLALDRRDLQTCRDTLAKYRVKEPAIDKRGISTNPVLAELDITNRQLAACFAEYNKLKPKPLKIRKP